MIRFSHQIAGHMPIPKIIHQTFPARRDMPEFLVENARKLQAMNPGWQYRLYEDADCARFIRDNYDVATERLFKAIHPHYGAARAVIGWAAYILISNRAAAYLWIVF